MKQFTGKPINDSDWSGIHDLDVTGKLETIHCKSAPGVNLESVKAGETYRYRGEFPAILVTTGASFPVFSVQEIEKLE